MDTDYGQRFVRDQLINPEFDGGAIAVRLDLGAGVTASRLRHSQELIDDVLEAVALVVTIEEMPHGERVNLVHRRGGRQYFDRHKLQEFDRLRLRPIVEASGYANPFWQYIKFKALLEGLTAAAVLPALTVANKVLDFIARVQMHEQNLQLQGHTIEAQRARLDAQIAQDQYIAWTFRQAMQVDTLGAAPRQSLATRRPSSVDRVDEAHGTVFTDRAAPPSPAGAPSPQPTFGQAGVSHLPPQRVRPNVDADVPADEATDLLARHRLATALLRYLDEPNPTRSLDTSLLTSNQADEQLTITRRTQLALSDLAVGAITPEALMPRLQEENEQDDVATPPSAPANEIEARPEHPALGHDPHPGQTPT